MKNVEIEMVNAVFGKFEFPEEKEVVNDVEEMVVDAIFLGSGVEMYFDLIRNERWGP
jgi:hypothetical protein